ncbi:MAG: class I SAM-dependent methyltransferase, partial [Candidatus Hinthialibacter sp.]
FDNDPRTVEQARKTLSQFSNAKVEKESIYEISYDNEFDMVFSIGVVQLLERPREAVERLIRALKPGGTLLLWLYAREGNDFVLNVIDPLRRRFTSKLPPRWLDYFTYLLSVPFYAYLKIVRPRSEYYQRLQAFPFRNIHLILFDHLLPTVAWYFTKEESLKLLDGLDRKSAFYVNGNSWTVTGVKS